jgi:hypothetical protein
VKATPVYEREEPVKLPPGYLHFGKGDNVAYARNFYSNNPFFVASLRDISNGYEVDPYGENGITYFSRIIEPLDKDVVRVYAKFDSEMRIVPSSVKLYKGCTKDTRVDVTSTLNYDENRIAAALMFQGAFYAQCIHANFHVC